MFDGGCDEIGNMKKIQKCCSEKAEETFLFGEDIFRNQIKPLYKELEFKIDRLLEFEISLPFQIALENNKLISFRKAGYWLHYCYRLHEHKEYTVECKNLSIKRYHTSVLIGVGYNSAIHTEESYGDIQSKFFDLSLDELNKQIVAYVIYTKDCRCFRITKEMLLPIVIMNLVDLENKKSNQNMFMLHNRMQSKRESLKHKDITEFLRIYNLYNEGVNPLISPVFYALEANRKLQEGFYDEAIINIQTSIEIFIRAVYQEILLHSGLNNNEVENALEDKSFISIVKKELHQYIGGLWDITKKGTPIWGWYYNTYKKRNRVVHGGYLPDFEEAYIAINSAMEFRGYIIERIRENNQYVRLNDYIY